MRIPGFLRLLQVLNRIADALDRAYPPVQPPPKQREIGLDALSQYDAVADYEAEMEEERLQEQGRDK
jgi:hypothetical protein